ncbi:hypothetical protein BU16DRAFT_580635 [Lophium mytilinum]|uniref:RING-type domain-containing protein n=1 Tax=Lophium mytilinum TaxID=390894 RepID=A0A6A6R089_9PEZI|nr:hypothetical protein BU16DRAFT_580635 [Lophium mytilinum]
MGTLTGDVPRLEEHCPHKLATSCRLTSTPNCCACADERAHSSSYSVYIDGVGFVQRGTRWQSYCWFCKEFWNNRIASADPPLPLSRTRIPELPDQTEFLERWNEFHQGYRIVKAADGTESRIAVVGEPFRDVSPGYLPLTVNELRTGQQNDATRALNRTTRATTPAEAASTAEPHRTIEEELDDLLEDEDDVDIPSAQPQRSLEIQQLRERRAEWTAERTRRVWGTREDIESDDYMSPITGLFIRHAEWNRRRIEMNRAEAEQRRIEGERDFFAGLSNSPASPHSSALSLTPVDLARRHTSPPDVEPVASRAPEQITVGSRPSGNEATSMPQEHPHLRQLRAEERQLETLEQLRNAQRRHREQLQHLRTEERQLEQLSDVQRRHLEQLQVRMEEPFQVGQQARREGIPRTTSATESLLDDFEHRLRAMVSPDSRGEEARDLLASLHLPTKHLDNDSRPEPKTDAEKMVKLECQICYQQVADIACVPCGHLVMCEWCADIQMPIKHRNIPETGAKCPMCRKKVTQRIRVHIG